MPSRISISAFIVDGSVPVKINGVKVDQESVAVLPGSYAFTTGLPYVGYGSKNVVLVKSPYVEADTYNIQSQLTNAGQEGRHLGRQEELQQVPRRPIRSLRRTAR